MSSGAEKHTEQMKVIMSLDGVPFITNDLGLLQPKPLRLAKGSTTHVSLSKTVALYTKIRILDIDGTGGLARILIGAVTRRSGDSTIFGVFIPCRAILRAVSNDAPRNVLFLIWHSNKSWSSK